MHIKAENISKKYNNFYALQNVSFEAKKGEVVGILGANGAGKTTILRILSGLIQPTSGKIYINNEEFNKTKHQIKQNIGIVNGGMGLPARVTGREILKFFGSLYNLDINTIENRINFLSNQLNLSKILDIRSEKYSTGMIQKIIIAKSLIQDPSLLILDEATNGLDIFARRELLNLIKEINFHNRLTLYSTHVMSEIEELCQRVIILHQGKIIYNNYLSNILENEQEKTLEMAFFKMINKRNT